MRGQVLSGTVPARRICQVLRLCFTFRDAGLHPDEKSGALMYRACAEHVLDIAHINYTLRFWPKPG